MALTKWSPAALLRKLLPGVAARERNSTQAEATGTPASESRPTQSHSSDPRQALKLGPAAEKVLLDVGMPPEESSIYDGPTRAADTPEGAARKFVVWVRAVGATGTFTTRTIGALYAECAEVDHREPVAMDRFLRALKNARGVRVASSTADPREQTWTIGAIEPRRVPKSLPATAKSQAAKAPPKLSPELASVLQRYATEVELSSPQLLRATAHAARRQGRARKQRGSRSVRWAA
jgi:hypothetical protein